MLTSWLSVGRVPTKAESWLPIWVMFEYWREHSSAWPLHNGACAYAEKGSKQKRIGQRRKRILKKEMMMKKEEKENEI